MTNTSKPVFGGLSNVDMEISEFDLGQGILLRKTYAHLFAANMLAFKPAGKEGYNEGPWKAAKGGFSFHIRIEIEMPELPEYNKYFDQKEMVWLIASLLRISRFPHLNVSSISDISFTKILESKIEPT